MYTDINFKTKKALVEAFKSGKQLTIYSPGPFPAPSEGVTWVEGPHYPAPHRWQAQVTLKNGIIVNIR